MCVCVCQVTTQKFQTWITGKKVNKEKHMIQSCKHTSGQTNTQTNKHNDRVQM